MIVECSACQTRFELDASLIPREGTHVRCSCCRKTFFLERDKSPGSTRTNESPSSVPGAAAPANSAGDLSACFDEAVEEDRQETFVALEADPHGAGEKCEEAVALPGGEEEPTGSVSAVQPANPTEAQEPPPAAAVKAPQPTRKEGSGTDSRQANTREPSPESACRPSVPRPPQLNRWPNLAGWLAVALLCAVGLFRGL